MKKFVYNLITIAVTLAAFAVAVYNIYRALEGADLLTVGLGLLCAAAGIYIALLINVVFHEAGHTVFGLCLGFKVVKIKLIQSEKIAGKKRPKKIYSIGETQLINTKTDKIKGRFLAVSLGGLLFSLLVFAGYSYVNIFLTGIDRYILLLLAMGMPVSVSVFLPSLLPAHIDGSHTDGAVIYGFTRNKDYAAVLLNLLKIQALMYGGASPSEIDEKLYFNVPLLSDDHISMFQLYGMRYFYYLDKGDWQKAAETNQRLKYFSDIIPQKDMLHLNISIAFDNIIAGDFEAARQNYILSAGCEEDKTVLRIKAYYSHYVLKNKETAQKYIERARQTKTVFKGMDILENKLIDKLAAETG